MDASRTQKADLEWRDGFVPVSRKFQDPYFSLVDGLEESRFVYLQGNRLPERLCDGFHVAELGFGTGLNLMLLAQAWADTGTAGTVHYFGFEAFPMDYRDMAHAHSAWPELDRWSRPVLEAWRDGAGSISLPGVEAVIIHGDARGTVPAWRGTVAAWYLDGFSPARNPELWEPDLLRAVGEHTATGGTCATYSAAGHVRQALSNAGFAVSRVPGFGRKRHMTVGIKN